jgi:hypothetical protein
MILVKDRTRGCPKFIIIDTLQRISDYDKMRCLIYRIICALIVTRVLSRNYPILPPPHPTQIAVVKITMNTEI